MNESATIIQQAEEIGTLKARIWTLEQLPQLEQIRQARRLLREAIEDGCDVQAIAQALKLIGG